MYRNKKVAAIIGAGGSGRRMAAPVPKQFLKIHGRTILEMSVDRFARMTAVDEIIVVVPSGYGDHCRELLGDGVSIVEGGQERQDSIYAAVRLLSQKGLVADDIVLIHDGVRPFVTADIIENVIAAAAESGAAIAAVPTRDTIRHLDEGTLDRSRLYNVQTPQGFRCSMITEAFQQAYADGFYGTDDASLVERLGVRVEIVQGSEENIKITTRADLRSEMRVGTGFDVHRLVQGRKLVLGGVEIPYELGLLGHSDADVLIHALMDAMLGAAALGDIGKLFPDNDPDYEGISSIILLEKVRSSLDDAGYTLANADITVICQKPKLADFIDRIRDNLADALAVSRDVISVKATTTEKLGFTGRGEGIAAEAVCMIKETK